MRDTRDGAPSGAERNAVLRALVRAIVATDCGGVERRAAVALGIHPSTLNGWLNGANGASFKILDALRAYLQRSDEEILAAGGDLVSLRRPRARGVGVEVRFGQLPAWPMLLDGARALDPSIPAWAWAAVADAVVWLSVPVTSSMALDLARFFLRHVPPPHG